MSVVYHTANTPQTKSDQYIEVTTHRGTCLPGGSVSMWSFIRGLCITGDDLSVSLASCISVSGTDFLLLPPHAVDSELAAEDMISLLG